VRESQGSLAHLLDKKAVGLGCAFKRENLRPACAIDDEGIHLAAPKGAQRVFSLGKPGFEIGNLAQAFAVRHHFHVQRTLIAALSRPYS
jgi:hypothetical protein